MQNIEHQNIIIFRINSGGTQKKYQILNLIFNVEDKIFILVLD